MGNGLGLGEEAAAREAMPDLVLIFPKEPSPRD